MRISAVKTTADIGDYCFSNQPLGFAMRKSTFCKIRSEKQIVACPALRVLCSSILRPAACDSKLLIGLQMFTTTTAMRIEEYLGRGCNDEKLRTASYSCPVSWKHHPPLVGSCHWLSTLSICETSEMRLRYRRLWLRYAPVAIRKFESFSNAEVVNAESNVGIVFENDFGGAHILYRPQLEELLGNGEQLGPWSHYDPLSWAQCHGLCDVSSVTLNSGNLRGYPSCLSTDASLTLDSTRSHWFIQI